MSAIITSRVLPAHVFDMLQRSALKYGGIGAGHYRQREGRIDIPLCVYGHCDGEENARQFRIAGIAPRADWMERDTSYTCGSDEAVAAINERKGKTGAALLDRVTFEEWCTELHVTRS